MKTEDFIALMESEKQQSVAVTAEFLSEVREKNQQLNPAMKLMLKEIEVYLLRGGKWVRPYLTRLAVKLLSKQVTPAIFKASLSMEVLHRYLLVHDDIMDQDLTRHNGPTLQKRYQDHHRKYYSPLPDETDSLGHAIVGGDVINALTTSLILESGLSTQTGMECLKAINQDFLDTAAGWLLEMDLKQRPIPDVTEKNILLAMKQVSAHYSVLWPLRCGQVLAGKRYGEWVPEIETYGTHVGLAFQIQDDILALFGDQNVTGKPVGNDIREGKKTLLLLAAYTNATNAERLWLEHIIYKPMTMRGLHRLRRLMDKTGALTYAKRQALTHMKKGVAALARLKGVNATSQDILVHLATYLTDRQV